MVSYIAIIPNLTDLKSDSLFALVISTYAVTIAFWSLQIADFVLYFLQFCKKIGNKKQQKKGIQSTMHKNYCMQ